MKAWNEPLKELGGYEEMIKAAQKPGLVCISGCIDAQKPHLIDALGQGKNRLVVTFQEQRAKELYEDLLFFDENTVYYPAKDVLFYQSDIRGNVLTAQRLGALCAVREQEHATVVTTFDALMNTMPRPERLWENVLHLAPSDAVELDELTARLVRMGYEREYQAEAVGQFALRGGILDIFPLTAEHPVRIELWGDEVDTIRAFDAESQKSIENLECVTIYPACELVLTDEERDDGIRRFLEEAEQFSDRLRADGHTQEAYRALSQAKELAEQWQQSESAGMDACLSYFCEERASILDYVNLKETLLFFDELARSAERGKQTELEFSESMKLRLEKGYLLPSQMNELFSYSEVMGKLSRWCGYALSSLDVKTCGLPQNGQFSVQAQSVSAYNRSFELLIADLKRYKKNKSRVLLLSGSRTRAQRLAEELLNEGLNSFYTEEKEHALLPGQVMVFCGKLHRGYEYPALKFAVITETDIFGAVRKKKKRRKAYEGEKIQQFSDLSVGDYVVHENHGLGIYRGIEKMEIDHKTKDYIKIEYADHANLYILATQLELIQKYAAKDTDRKPKLHRLGGAEWGKTKGKVRGAVREIAQDLVKLYAARQAQEGYAYGPDTVWQREFEELFSFEETEDQVLAIEETKRDMESKKIMDRLICGDVGYGKTEIAIRAAFKAAQESKQVAYLAPTTILAQQIYNTFVQRMKDFPVHIELLCRFRTPAEQKKTIAGLKNGQVDIVVGTHRLLSADVTYKDLGLLVVDEEQRFGVAHKEKIKKLKTNVDVLTLTATPIPRTLHMSLIGIRDMSVLEEPPMDRVPVQTYIMEYNEEMVREAITRELARGGQVYYVYNRVKDIADRTARLQELVPDAVIAYAHGQMRETQLEDIMYRFINGEIDVLVSTTIIETGMDISNVNTMIIHDADNMGLSQLYQLRGRVGRSNRTAYAFLMYRRDKMLREVAQKRLSAIREYSELGSGFKVAMKDLEIRGAGNLLGAQQSGHMEAVGYDLYCKMLHEAVREAKGEETEEPFDTSIDVKTDAFLPTGYIANEAQKLDLYKRIACIGTDEEAAEMLDELIDRFGEPPQPAQNLLEIARLKALAHSVYVQEITQEGQTLRLCMYERAKIDAAQIPALLESVRGLSFSAKDRAFLYAGDVGARGKNRDILVQLRELLEQMKKLLACCE